MPRLNGLGFNVVHQADNADRPEYVLIQRPLRKILAFTRRSIDDVVNNPIAKNEVLGFFKLHKQIERGLEISDLEKQWNSVA